MEALTLLIPNYNKGPYLRDTIDCLLRQDDENWLAIIIDDASTDTSRSFLESYPALADSRFTVRFNEQHRGKAYCMNRMVEMASTDILGEFDSDDVLADRCVREVRRAYHQSDSGLVYTNFVYCDERLEKLKGGYCKALAPGETALEVNCVSAFRTFRKSALAKTAGFDESLESAIDKDLVYKLEEVTEPFFVSQYLYYYRLLPESLSLGAENAERARRHHEIVKARAFARRNGDAKAIRLFEKAQSRV
jgi:glycosyltransferase involved in cell wall biosynthesis